MNTQDTYILGNLLLDWLIACGWFAGSFGVAWLIYWMIKRFIISPLEGRPSLGTRLYPVLFKLSQQIIAIAIVIFGVRQARNTLSLTYIAESLIDAFVPVVVGGIFVWLGLQLFKWLTPKETAIQTFVRSQLIPFFAVLIALFWLSRFWIIRPLRCMPNCASQTILNVDLRNANLSNAILINTNLRGGDFSNANLAHADLSRANLTFATLRNVDLTGALLIGADLTGADLRGAILDDADLSGANFDQADLTKLDLTRTNLKGSNFTKSTLIEVNLNGVDLSGANFVQANLGGANLNNAALGGAYMTSADLSNASLVNAEITGALLNLATLTGADLHDVDLSGTSLIGADLSSANLHHGELVGATLIGSNLNGTIVRAADLTSVRFFKDELVEKDVLIDDVLAELNDLQRNIAFVDANLQGITFDATTVWPSDKGNALNSLLGISASSNATGNPSPTTGFTIGGSIGNSALVQTALDTIVTPQFTGNVSLTSVSTATAMWQLCTDQSTLFAITNRSIRDTERTVCEDKGQIPVEILLALEAIVPVVSTQNTLVGTLTSNEFYRLLTAERWRTIHPSWPNAPLQRYFPDESSDVPELLERVFPEIDDFIEDAPNTMFLSNSQEIVSQLANDPFGIAFVDYATYLQHSDTLTLIEVSDMPFSAETIASNQYPLVHPIQLIVRQKNIVGRTAVGDYLKLFLQTVHHSVDGSGYFPIPSELFTQTQDALVQSMNGEFVPAGPLIDTTLIELNDE